MATTLMPLDPATSPQRVTRVLTISADLLPAEIIGTRRARWVRRLVCTLLALFIALLGGWYGFASYRTSQTQQEADALSSEARLLQQQHQTRYADVVDVRNATNVINKQLAVLLANDLRWAALFDTLRSTGAPAGIVISGVNGELASTTSEAGAAETALPSASGVRTIGTLVVTGDAPNKPALARYVDALAGLKVVANPYLSSAAESEGAVQFNLRVDITADALGGRFSSKPTGGK